MSIHQSEWIHLIRHDKMKTKNWADQQWQQRPKDRKTEIKIHYFAFESSIWHLRSKLWNVINDIKKTKKKRLFTKTLEITIIQQQIDNIEIDNVVHGWAFLHLDLFYSILFIYLLLCIQALYNEYLPQLPSYLESKCCKEISYQQCSSQDRFYRDESV